MINTIVKLDNYELLWLQTGYEYRKWLLIT